MLQMAGEYTKKSGENIVFQKKNVYLCTIITSIQCETN